MQDFIFEWQQHTEARPRTGPCTLHAAGLLHASQDAEMRGAALPSPLQSVCGVSLALASRPLPSWAGSEEAGGRARGDDGV